MAIRVVLERVGVTVVTAPFFVECFMRTIFCTVTTAPELSFAARFVELAEEGKDRPALTMADHTMSFADLDGRATDLAHHFLSLDVGVGDFVTVAEPNSFAFVVACMACWKIGATPQPVSSRLPRRELEAIVDLADSKVVVGMDVAGRQSLPLGFVAPPVGDGPALPDVVSAAWKAPTSGGSTGRPKLIVSGDPSTYGADSRGRAAMIGATGDNVVVIPGPLYHNGPFIWMFASLLAGSHVVLLPRFDAETTLAAIADHGAEGVYLVPTMMQRIWKLPEADRLSYDMSSLKVAFHLGEPCAKWLKQAWIDWIGPEKVWELYAGTEGQGLTVLNGVEWLEHPGSVGKPVGSEMKICDEDGVEVPTGEVGDVWMRLLGRETAPYMYVGAETVSVDGWETLGDIGWMDDAGYLFLADRRKDMILVGGANVYPAEVEAALNEHEGISSAAVVGLPDDEMGNRIHAIIEADADIDLGELAVFLGERLVRYKIPRTFETVAEPLRDDAGKIRRSALRAERL